MEADESQGVDADNRMPTLGEALIGAGIGALIIYGATFIPFGVLRWLSIGFGVVWVIVMLSYAMVVTGSALRPKLVPRVKKLVGHTRRDPVLGLMVRDVRAGLWTATPVTGQEEIEFEIAGDKAPDEQLLQRACEVATGFEELERQIAAFLIEQADLEGTANEEMASQVRALRIVGVVFLLEDHPKTFRIEFKGPDEEIFWQCEYTDGRPEALDFD